MNLQQQQQEEWPLPTAAVNKPTATEEPPPTTRRRRHAPQRRRARFIEELHGARDNVRVSLNKTGRRANPRTRGLATNPAGETYELYFDNAEMPLFDPSTGALVTPSATVAAVFKLPLQKTTRIVQQRRIPLMGETIRFTLSSDTISKRVIRAYVKRIEFNPLASKRSGTLELSKLGAVSTE